MWKRKKHHNEEINFWQSSSDLMTALMLILILVILLLALCLIHNPDEYDDYNPYSEPGETESNTDSFYDDDIGGEGDDYNGEDDDPWQDDDDHNGGNNGGGDHDGDDEGEEPGEYPEDNEGIKSAVYVMLVDGETKRTVLEEGVGFDLRSDRGVLQILNTYYPEKITYRDYETTENGTFYLPEKIPQGEYFLRNLSEATGYDLADDTPFVVDKLYDWPEPLVVTVPVYASRNTIHVQMTDADTKQTVSGGTFDVIAEENITTLDGTVRYKKGDIVSTIICDENGSGDSKELYLGTYSLKQTEIPEYYANVPKNILVTIERKSESNEPTEIKNEKTQIKVKLTDELTESPIANATFEVSDGNNVKEYKTDKKGTFDIIDVEKDTTFEITQKTSDENYIIPENSEKVNVSTMGRVGTDAKSEVNITNRMIRVNISAADAVLGGKLSDISFTLYDNNDAFIKQWTTSGSVVSMNDLKPGTYYLTANGNEKKHYPISITNTKQEQTIDIKIWTWKSYAALAVGAVIGILTIYIAIRIFKKLWNKRMAKKSKE